MYNTEQSVIHTKNMNNKLDLHSYITDILVYDNLFINIAYITRTVIHNGHVNHRLNLHLYRTDIYADLVIYRAAIYNCHVNNILNV